MEDKIRSFRQRIADARHRCGVPAILAVSGINVGFALRFWRSLYNRPDARFTLDWTPLVYWGIGIVCAVMTLRISRDSGRRLSKAQHQTLVALSGLILFAYFLPPAIIVYHSISRLWN